MPDVRIDDSVTPAAHRAGLIAALEARRVDNRFHYVGEPASNRWRALAAMAAEEKAAKEAAAEEAAAAAERKQEIDRATIKVEQAYEALYGRKEPIPVRVVP